MKRNSIIFAVAVFCAGFTSTARCQNDIPVGSWRTHFNYRQSFKVAGLDGRIYGSQGDAILEVDPASGTVTTLTKANRLSDVNITAIASHEETGSLIVSYLNGNLDVLRENTTYNLSELLRSNISTSKRINAVAVGPESFFACTDFGMLEISLQSLEILNTLSELGRNGKTIAVFDGTVREDSLFLASEEGILGAHLNAGLNLLDFRNWSRSLEAEGSFDFVVATAGTVYAAKRGGRLWQNEGSGWHELATADNINFLYAGTETLYYGAGNKLNILDTGGNVNTILLGANAIVRDAEVVDGTLWIADGNGGLARRNGGSLEYHYAEGPFEKDIFSISAAGGSVFSLPGGFEKNGLLPYNRPASVSEFAGSGWQQLFSSTQLENASDVAMASGTPYILLYGHGIYDAAAGVLIDDSSPGSLLVSNNGFVPVTAFVAGQQGGLVFSSNQTGPKYLHRKEDGSWQALAFIPDAVPAAVKLVQNAYGDFWGILQGNAGLVVFNIETSEYRLFGSGSGLPSLNVNDIAFDRNDYGWIATANGLAIVANTYEALEPADLLITFPAADNAFVLDEDPVNTVAVDAANRKWIGTNDGLYLLDEFGAGTLRNYTRQNSPLISNEVREVVINHESGEVFVLTSEGLQSYRAEAARPAPVVARLKIFPNPARPATTKVVSIEGLPFDAVVKITDEAGRLVRELVSFGGRATWDLRDYNGRLAVPGIYLVLGSERDGENAVAGKIAVIH